MKDYPIAIRYLVRILLIFAVVTVLSITKQLLVPLFFSIFLAYLLYPTANKLEQFKVPRIITNFAVIITFMAFVIGVLYWLIILAGSISSDFPELDKKISSNISNLQTTIEVVLGFTVEQQKTVIKNMGMNGDVLTTLIEAGKNTILTLTLIPVYTFLLLFYRDKFKDFIFMLVNDENESIVKEILKNAADVLPKYLKGLIVVCILLVGMNTLGFKLIGLKYPLFLGLIAAIFNLIPYLGTVIGYGIVLLFVFTTQSASAASGVIIQFFIVQFIENNILTPNITGSYVRINPLVIIFSLIAGGIVWGLPGMFLVIPTLGILKIVFEGVEEWKPYAFLLGTTGTEKHSVTIHSLRKRFGWED